MKKVLVIGGGASGIMAASIAAREGKDVTLFEKNEKLGKKIFITGKGRCNITNAVDMNVLIDNIPGNGNFLHSAFYTFSNYQLMELIESLGVKLKIERGNRVFPNSDKSSDIIKALERYLAQNKVNINLKSSIDDIVIDNNKISGVIINNNKIECDSVIVSTGGLSYPLTGSTGDGYRFARKAGHRIEALRPSLIPLITEEEWVRDLQGLSLKNASIKIMYGDKVLYEDFGEMLFTHFGVSGPIILSASRYAVDVLPDKVKLIINLKPALTFEQLDKRVQSDFQKYTRKVFKNSLDDLLPQKMIPIIVKLSMIDENKRTDQITKAERLRFVKLLREMPLTITGTRPISEAIVTRGGVSVKEINPNTMESKIIRGLFFTGEVIDVDGITGGYNLQIAFSTGYCAGLYC